MNEWISIEDRFPDKNGDYIIYTGNDSDPEVISLYYCGNNNWDDGTGIAKDSYYGISHWMPLPEPPKEENDYE